MSNNQIVGHFLPSHPDGLAEPKNGLLYVETEAGLELHVCYSRAQFRAVLDACPATSGDIRETLFEGFADAGIPEKFPCQPLVVRGMIAERLIEALVTKGEIREQDLQAFYDTGPSCYMYVPEIPEEGDQAFVSACDDEDVCFVWIVSSRDELRYLADRYARLMDNGEPFRQELYPMIDRSVLPETGRSSVCINGAVGATLVCLLFCHDERQRSAS